MLEFLKQQKIQKQEFLKLQEKQLQQDFKRLNESIEQEDIFGKLLEFLTTKKITREI